MTDLQPVAETGQLAVKNDYSIQPVSVDDIDSLDTAEAAPVDLMSDYWSPATPGEFKKVIFDHISSSQALDQSTGEVMDLLCAYFFVKDGGTVKRIRNGSKRLVGALQSCNIAPGTPLEIRYLGKKANSTNQFKSDNWSIKPLVVNVAPKQ